jgi:tetratricopeptide (TPR) repeat protein
MRKLLDAYETVSDDGRRASYDRYVAARRASMSFAERMAQKKDDLGAQAKLILHHLLEGNFDAAIELRERLSQRRPSFDLAQHLDDCDYLDSLFLLGEAYETRRMWRTALRFYWEAYESEKDEPRKRYFFDELKDRLRVLFSQRLVRGLAPEDALKNYRRALGMCVNSRDAALIYKKIAALHSRLGQPGSAVEALDKAKELCPGMKTLDSLKASIAGD